MGSCRRCFHAQIRRFRDALAGGSKTDVGLAEVLSEALVALTPSQRVDALGRVFLTGEGGERQRLMTVDLKAEHPDVDEQLTRAQNRFVCLHKARGGLVVAEATVALLRLAGAVMQRYTDLKRRRAALDFDDLIRATANLLSDGPAAAWVLYKLDGGLDHILVDEAQDTAPLQWSIIERLAAEFFAGRGARDEAQVTAVTERLGERLGSDPAHLRATILLKRCVRGV